jgi:hypothetical protein
MANEFTHFTKPGLTLYGILMNAAGQFFNTVTPAFETPVLANRANYVISFADSIGLGRYRASLPAGATAADRYDLAVYQQRGGSPNISDPLLTTIRLEWLGSSEAPVSGGSGGSGIAANDMELLRLAAAILALSSSNLTPGTYTAGVGTGTLTLTITTDKVMTATIA